MTIEAVALIGFGEVGQILAEDLAHAGVSSITAWDVAFSDPASRAARALPRHAVRGARDAVDAVSGAPLVISAVTAAQGFDAARSCTPGLMKGAFFLDLNSCSPEQKKSSAALVEAAGGRYVEAAVMSPVPPRRIGSPMLLGGPHAQLFLPTAASLGFSGAEVFSDVIGRAAAAKLCRSVMVKGVEALLTESMLAARHYGVEDVVLRSLSDLFPLPDWDRLAAYMISRALEHGGRRSEEMREAALTVSDAGVPAVMSLAAAELQAWAASYGAAASRDLNTMLDAIRTERSGDH